MKLALTEACSNSIRHAYDGGRDGAVEIRYELAVDRLAVEVSDDGEGFNPELLEVETGASTSGSGITIIRAHG